jgi:hypothetical protein
MSVRLFHRGMRVVLVVQRGNAGDERWWVPSVRPHDWGAILRRPLELLDLDPQLDGTNTMTFRLGRMGWTASRCWSTIWLRLDRGSAPKRTLVAAALLKAARYGSGKVRP